MSTATAAYAFRLRNQHAFVPVLKALTALCSLCHRGSLHVALGTASVVGVLMRNH